MAKKTEKFFMMNAYILTIISILCVFCLQIEDVNGRSVVSNPTTTTVPSVPTGEASVTGSRGSISNQPNKTLSSTSTEGTGSGTGRNVSKEKKEENINQPGDQEKGQNGTNTIIDANQNNGTQQTPKPKTTTETPKETLKTPKETPVTPKETPVTPKETPVTPKETPEANTGKPTTKGATTPASKATTTTAEHDNTTKEQTVPDVNSTKNVDNIQPTKTTTVPTTTTLKANVTTTTTAGQPENKTPGGGEEIPKKIITTTIKPNAKITNTEPTTTKAKTTLPPTTTTNKEIVQPTTVKNEPEQPNVKVDGQSGGIKKPIKTDTKSHMPGPEETDSSSHFMAYFMTFVVICIAGYIIYHNKQKILAFILEGRKEGGSRRRPSTKEYKQLKTEEVMPSLEKSAPSNKYVY